MKRACVIGWPIEHSRSPMIHGFWLKKYGIEGSYTKEAVKPEDLGVFLKSLSANGFSGCNITVPHKEAAYKAMPDLGGTLHSTATPIGAINTVWVSGTKLHATNTDPYGFTTHLLSSVPGLDLRGKTAVILGAGGAAKSIEWALSAIGVREIRITNRSLERAAALAKNYPNSKVKRKAVAWEERSQALSGASLLVNTTTLGMKGQPELDIDLGALPTDAVVNDIVYVPLETNLLRRAKMRGLRTVDGLGMLLHQAVPGFQKWFGVKPDVTQELRALIEADIKAHV